MTAAELAECVKGARRAGAGFVALCPAHDDARASLSFADGTRGLVVKCHAGCSAEAVAGALGLRLADFFHPNTDSEDTRRGLGCIAAIYHYRDPSGALLYEVVRYEPKTFRPRRPDGAGGWTWNLNGVRRVLYRLHELRGHRTVYVVEGEQDADALTALGIPATTNTGGAGKWTHEFTAQLFAAGITHIVILPDNDTPGESHARTVAGSCLAAGLTVKVVRLPGLAPKGDVSDWLGAGHTRADLAEVVQAMPEVTPADLIEPDDSRRGRGDGLALTSIGELLAEPEEECAWLVEGRLPVGGLSLIAGKPKAGKSTASRCLALAVARGEPWLSFSTRQGPALYLGFEEKRQEVRRHFRAMGARSDDALWVLIERAPDDALGRLRETAEKVRPALIVVDTVARLVRVKDWNDYGQVTAGLEPLLALARETGAHVLLVHHAGKGERDGGDIILGSTAIFGTVDTALLVKRSARYRTLSSIQRYGPDLEETTVTLDTETGLLSAGMPRREADEAEAALAILVYLAGQAEPVEESAIDEAVEGKRGPKVKALRRLVKDGRVTRTGAGKKGEPYRYADSGSSFPHIPGNQETRKADTSPGARHGDEDSGSLVSVTGGGPAEPQEQESGDTEEVEL